MADTVRFAVARFTTTGETDLRATISRAGRITRAAASIDETGVAPPGGRAVRVTPAATTEATEGVADRRHRVTPAPGAVGAATEHASAGFARVTASGAQTTVVVALTGFAVAGHADGPCSGLVAADVGVFPARATGTGDTGGPGGGTLRVLGTCATAPSGRVADRAWPGGQAAARVRGVARGAPARDTLMAHGRGATFGVVLTGSTRVIRAADGARRVVRAAARVTADAAATVATQARRATVFVVTVSAGRARTQEAVRRRVRADGTLATRTDATRADVGTVGGASLSAGLAGCADAGQDTPLAAAELARRAA